MKVRIDEVKGTNLARAEKLLAGIPGGVERAIQGAMTRAVSHLRKQSTSRITERYAIAAGAVRANENISVSYRYGGGGVSADITFSGSRIPLTRFKGSSNSPGYDSSRRVPVLTAHGWKLVHPGTNGRGHILNSTSPQTLTNTFVAHFRSGHTGIFERTGSVSGSGRDAIGEKYGTSVAEMVGHGEVAEKLTNDAMEAFDARIEHEITRILGGF